MWYSILCSTAVISGFNTLPIILFPPEPNSNQLLSHPFLNFAFNRFPSSKSQCSQASPPTATMANVTVCVRFRPQNKIELHEGGLICVEKNCDQSFYLKDEKDEKTLFTFDRTFYQDSSQQEVFSYVALPVVQDALSAINGTVLAYGQVWPIQLVDSRFVVLTRHRPRRPARARRTPWRDPTCSSTTPRVPGFSRASPRRSSCESTRRTPPANTKSLSLCSFGQVEIYMERIRDLYDVSKDNLVVKEDQTRGISIAGVTEIYVEGEREMLQLLEAAIKNRAVGATNMNQGSSRSHCMFLLTIQRTSADGSSSQVGKIYLVDLAGSEKVDKTGAEGRLLDEAKMINKSLSALGNVINALTSDKATHIPYRDSKLTRILQESLGGNSRTTLLCCCSPSTYNYTESVSTVRFGLRAKQIKNKPVANKEVGRGELQRRLQESELECELLRQHIQSLTLAIQRLPGGDGVLRDIGEPISGETSGSNNSLKGSQLLAACIEGLHGILASEGMAWASELPTIKDTSDIPKLLPSAVEEHLSSQSSEGNDEKDLKYLEEALDDMAARLNKLESKIGR
ncbi:unnamed protein product [Closterium sp. Yama58-4]|nr:unnamed protein product [Closterium sp. Yama58-4]